MARRIVSILLAVVLVATAAVSFIVVYRQNRTGKISSAVAVALTEENRAWILERYGDCETPEELIVRLNDEICTEYTYYASLSILVQHFNFDRFVEKKRGLCFDYCCYFKVVFGTVFPQSQVYIADMRKGWKFAHSYNFAVIGDKRYFVDLTTDQNRYKQGKKRIMYEDIGEQDFEAYAASYDERIFNYH